MIVRRLALVVALIASFGSAGPARASLLAFNGFNAGGQGLLSFTPGLGDTLTIGAGNGGNGAPVTDFVNSAGLCSGDCSIVGGFLTLTSGPETSGMSGGGIFSYGFGAGGTVDIFGKVPTLGINSSTLLLSATFNTGTAFSGAGTVGSFLGSLNLASISLNPSFGTYMYAGASNDELSISISPSCATGGLCTGSLIQSTTALQTVPEPGTMTLFGTALVGIAGIVRKRRHAADW